MLRRKDADLIPPLPAQRHDFHLLVVMSATGLVTIIGFLFAIAALKQSSTATTRVTKVERHLDAYGVCKRSLPVGECAAYIFSHLPPKVRATLKGAKGDTGARGARGATGARGPAGKNGTTGARGARGAKGAPGSTGTAGATGPPGPPGPRGALGPVGPVGPAGPVGPVGPIVKCLVHC